MFPSTPHRHACKAVRASPFPPRPRIKITVPLDKGERARACAGRESQPPSRKNLTQRRREPQRKPPFPPRPYFLLSYFLLSYFLLPVLSPSLSFSLILNHPVKPNSRCSRSLSAPFALFARSSLSPPPPPPQKKSVPIRSHPFNPCEFSQKTPPPKPLRALLLCGLNPLPPISSPKKIPFAPFALFARASLLLSPSLTILSPSLSGLLIPPSPRLPSSPRTYAICAESSSQSAYAAAISALSAS